MLLFVVIEAERIMNVSLSLPLEEYVSKKVESGLYNSASEVIREALRLLQEKEQKRERKAQLDELLIERLAKVGQDPISSSDVRKNLLASLEATSPQS